MTRPKMVCKILCVRLVYAKAANTYRIKPVCVHCLLAARTLGDQHSPFASVLAPRILPLGFYALFEKVKVCSRSYPTRGLDVIVQAAKKLQT